MASFISPVFFTFASIVPALAVNVLMGGTRWHYKDYFGGTSTWFAGCSDLRPGECCLKPPGLIIDPGFTTFSLLSDLDIAFLWQARRLTPERQRTARGCSGLPFRSFMGAPSWTYQWSNPNPFVDGETSARVAGASYLRLPPKLPPDKIESVWLGIEGLKGFVWGGGKWFADAEGYPSSGSFLPKRQEVTSNVSFPRPQISKNKSLFGGGTFFAKESEMGRWVDWVEINGTRFDLVEREDMNGTILRYGDSTGTKIDISTNNLN
ncbi:MAG: hypothetical protein L6R41_001783 [Letrouitia leprolyta]|nr:MAG: hypothetical protein L6R41_001783 [Letrouitia leprolyta]